jgi:hypothetical protein
VRKVVWDALHQSWFFRGVVNSSWISILHLSAHSTLNTNAQSFLYFRSFSTITSCLFATSTFRKMNTTLYLRGGWWRIFFHKSWSSLVVFSLRHPRYCAVIFILLRCFLWASYLRPLFQISHQTGSTSARLSSFNYTVRLLAPYPKILYWKAYFLAPFYIILILK